MAGGRRNGIPNYKKDKLLNIIDSVRPIGPNEWQEVARMYKESSGEAEERPYLDVKRHFYEKLCNGGKKPTGRSQPPEDVQRALVIQRKILEKSNVGVYGEDGEKEVSGELNYSSDEDDGEEDDDFDKRLQDGDDTIVPSTREDSPLDDFTTTPVVPQQLQGSYSSTINSSLPNSDSGGSLNSRSSRKKRACDDNKSKNCRTSNKNPRSSASSAIQNLVTTIAEASQTEIMMRMMEHQQTQQQQTMQMIMQQNQMMMQMFSMSQQQNANTSGDNQRRNQVPIYDFTTTSALNSEDDGDAVVTDVSGNN